MQKASTWTFLEDEKLRRLVLEHEGETYDVKSIAEELGRSIAAIRVRVSRTGLGDWHRVKQGGRKDDRRFKGDKEELQSYFVESGKRLKNDCPVGMLGHHHSEETKKIISQKGKITCSKRTPRQQKIINKKRLETNMARYGTYSPQFRTSDSSTRAHGGKREDLGGLYVRSGWEANYARYLNFLIEQGEILCWEYEPDTFYFEGVRRGALSYTPDFKVTEKDGRIIYHEVKGWMDGKSSTKLKRMKKYHPEIEIIIIDEPAYNGIKKFSALISNWEGR